MTTWKIDTAHTDVSFSAKHMMVTTVRGKFAEVDGSITLDENDPTRSHGEFTVAAASLATGVERRDQHLRSADFFDVGNYPTIAFSSTGIVSTGKDTYAVTGDLTIRDTTRPITFDVEVLGYYTSMTGGRKVGLSATAKLARDEWNLGWNVALETGGWLVGKTVALEIDVSADEVLAPVEAPVLTPVAA
ncbi:MAG TPA: YceI family protein [Candidatus Acidoferrum sp.]|nr:YceI family protein [Candidatus Acidoferrum sp.]